MVVSLSGADVIFFIVSGWFDSGARNLLWTVIHCGNVGRVSIRVGGPGFVESNRLSVTPRDPPAEQ